MKFTGLAFVCLLAGFCAQAQAATLDFSGLKDGERPDGFYNGGAGSKGSVGGPQNDFGVTFDHAIVRCNLQLDCEGGLQQDALFFVTAESLTDTGGLDYFVNVDGGFAGDVAFTFATTLAGRAEFWSGASGSGTLLGTIDLGSDGCPDFDHCSFRNTNGAVALGQIAHSISFTGVSARIFAIDNLSLNLADSPISAAPEPAAWTLALAGFGLAGAALRRRRKAALA